MSWQRVGYLLAACGQNDQAIDAFKHAVAVNPKYARGWFNLGSMWAQRKTPGAFLASEGALGIAGSLDHNLRGEGVALLPDNDAYQSGIDVSKLVPADWTMGQHERPSRMPLTALAGLALLWSVIRDLGKDKVFGRLAERIGVAGVLCRLPFGRLPGWVGFGLSVAAIGWLGAGDTGPERVCLLAFGAALVLLPVTLLPNPRQSHTPITMVVASAVLGLFGVLLPASPSGAADEADQRGQLRLLWGAAAVAASVVVLMLLAMMRWVPLGHLALGVGIGALTTLLMPFSPYAGPHLGRRSGLVATVGFALLTGGLALGLL